MGAVFNRVYSAAEWTVDKTIDVLSKIDTFDGLEKINGVALACIELYILYNGSGEAGGLARLKLTINGYNDVCDGKKGATTIRDFLVASKKKLGGKSFTQIREDLCNLDNSPTTLRSLIATTQKIAWPIITAITVNDLVGKFGGPSYNFVVAVFNGSTFVVGKVVGVTAIPVKLVLLTYAFLATVFEHLCKLGHALVQTRKTNQKITLLKTGVVDPAEQARIAELKKERFTKLQGKIRQLMKKIQDPRKEGIGIKTEDLNAKVDELDITFDELSAKYLTLVKQAAILKILNKNTEEKDKDKVNQSLEILKNMEPSRFLDKKTVQYAQRIDDIWNTVLKSSMEIISTGIKVAALGTTIGNIYVGVQAMSAIWGTESEWACNVLIAELKFVGASIGLFKFLFVDGKTTEKKPVDFALAG
ncbi:MAG: hypothetical protein ACXWM7_07595 [Parachlamydiaceae bacterium]